jgi:serine/threonine protein phosphatase PrpC
MSNRLRITLGQYSDKGPKAENEDFYGAITPDPPLLDAKGIAIAIADGMSGSGEGREASEFSVKGFLFDYYSTPDSWSVQTSVQKVVGAVNSWLYNQSHKRHGTAGALGTTFTVLVLKSGTAHLFHLGDSRIYRVREREIECLTHDHRVVLSDNRSYLNRAMGIEPDLQMDYRNVPLEVGDCFLLTTDGLHDFLSEHDITKIVKGAGQGLDNLAEVLVRGALDNGGRDNATCQIVCVDGLPLEDADEFYRKLTELPFPPPLEPGMMLDGYRIDSEIHASKRSQLYSAVDTATAARVVLKTPSINYEDDPVYIEQFIMEEWVGRRVNSPYVLKILEQQRKRSFLYHVAELVDGQTLRAWIEDHPHPDIDDVFAYVDQITRGLRAFHRLEMVHRDLKPENIMISQDGVAKIIDFGSVKIAGVAELASPLDRSAVVGTENYTGPEYFAGSTGTAASDLFALGVIAYEMYTGGAHPYRGKTPRRPVTCRGRYVPALHHNPMIPPWLDGALEKAVRCDPRDRYEALSEFIQDLSHPNPYFMQTTPLPLLDRNPLAFWRGLAIALLVLNILLSILLAR